MFGDESGTFNVVVNDQGQMSIWPSDRENALGWRDEGFKGTKPECLAHIDEVWLDLCPTPAQADAGTKAID